MYVCMYVCIYVCVYVCICMYMYVCVCVCVCVCVGKIVYSLALIMLFIMFKQMNFIFSLERDLHLSVPKLPSLSVTLARPEDVP
jgi:hypothetical protein